MYRPNRIGPHPMGNLDKAFIDSAITDFATEEYGTNLYKVNSLNTATTEDFASEHILFSNSSLHISAFRSVGLGVQLTGGLYAKNFMFSVSGEIFLNTDVSHECHVEMVIGRLAAAPAGIGSAAINVPNPIVVPLDYKSASSGSIQAGINKTLVTTLKDGGTPPGTEFDISAFWRITNARAVDINTGYMTCNVALHKYVSDIETHDPNR